MPKAKHTPHGEKKSVKGYSLTPTAVKMLDELARELGFSPSHLIEKIARREISLVTPLGECLTNS